MSITVMIVIGGFVLLGLLWGLAGCGAPRDRRDPHE